MNFLLLWKSVGKYDILKVIMNYAKEGFSCPLEKHFGRHGWKRV